MQPDYLVMIFLLLFAAIFRISESLIKLKKGHYFISFNQKEITICEEVEKHIQINEIETILPLDGKFKIVTRNTSKTYLSNSKNYLINILQFKKLEQHKIKEKITTLQHGI